jgi:pilus assembly protein CpaB
MRSNRPGAETTSKVFMQNVKVLAVGQEVESNDKTRLHATSATVATLLVSPQDSERLALASIEGRLILTLRSWTDSRPVDTDGAISSGLVGEPVAQNQPSPGGAGAGGPRVAVAGRHGKGGKQAPPTAMPTADLPPKPDVVEILRGDRFEQRNFKRGDNR